MLNGRWLRVSDERSTDESAEKMSMGTLPARDQDGLSAQGGRPFHDARQVLRAVYSINPFANDDRSETDQHLDAGLLPGADAGM